jgi:hypothetical protein
MMSAMGRLAGEIPRQFHSSFHWREASRCHKSVLNGSIVTQTDLMGQQFFPGRQLRSGLGEIGMGVPGNGQ